MLEDLDKSDFADDFLSIAFMAQTGKDLTGIIVYAHLEYAKVCKDFPRYRK
jgi:hypothetical protein